MKNMICKILDKSTGAIVDFCIYLLWMFEELTRVQHECKTESFYTVDAQLFIDVYNSFIRPLHKCVSITIILNIIGVSSQIYEKCCFQSTSLQN